MSLFRRNKKKSDDDRIELVTGWDGWSRANPEYGPFLGYETMIHDTLEDGWMAAVVTKAQIGKNYVYLEECFDSEYEAHLAVNKQVLDLVRVKQSQIFCKI